MAPKKISDYLTLSVICLIAGCASVWLTNLNEGHVVTRKHCIEAAVLRAIVAIIVWIIYAHIYDYLHREKPESRRK